MGPRQRPHRLLSIRGLGPWPWACEKAPLPVHHRDGRLEREENAVAVYHRVSTLGQDPTLARDELHAAAARLGGEVVLDLEETGSGARNDRPGLQRLMQ